MLSIEEKQRLRYSKLQTNTNGLVNSSQRLEAALAYRVALQQELEAQENRPWSKLVVVNMLLELESRGLLQMWLPTIQDKPLHQKCVDFVLQFSQQAEPTEGKSALTPVKVTKDHTASVSYRDKIAELYGATVPADSATPAQPIGVVQMRPNNKNVVLSSAELENRIIGLQEKVAPISVTNLDGTKLIYPAPDSPLVARYAEKINGYRSPEKEEVTLPYADLVRQVREHIVQARSEGLTTQDKLEILRYTRAGGESRYEIKFALLLMEMANEGEVLEWYPSLPYSPLDEAKIDFVVSFQDGWFIPFQVASKTNQATKKKTEIGKFITGFSGLSAPIGVIHLLNSNAAGSVFKPDEQIKREMWDLASSVIAIHTVDL